MQSDHANLRKRLLNYASSLGIKVVELGDGHFQIHGKLLVNYYPFSKNMTAYVAGTVAGHQQVKPEQALAMSNKMPKLAAGAKKDKRKNNTKEKRWKLWQAGLRRCYVCGGEFLEFSETTLEHIIPLDAGGLDHPNNRTLSHDLCNKQRANRMPELKTHTGSTPLNMVSALAEKQRLPTSEA